MKRLAIAAMCLAAFNGCGPGPSYEQALAAYNAEVTALERIENELSKATADHKVMMREAENFSDEAGLKKTVESAGRLERQITEIEDRIAVQKDRVQRAFDAKEKLAR